MKAIIKTKVLSEILAQMKLVCGTRTTLPVLTCVRLRAEDQKIAVESTNLDTFLSVTIDADGAEDGECVVSCNRLLEGVKQAEEESVHLQTDAEVLSLKFDNSVMRLRTLKPEEFPSWPKATKEKETTVDAVAFSALIARAMPFVAKDESILQGVFVSKNGTGINVVGCDRKSMIALHSVDILEWGEDVIVLPEVARHLGSFSGKISAQVTETHIWLRGGGRCLASKLLVDKYPEWKRVLPEPGKNKFTADRAALTRAVRCAMITMARESDVIVIEAEKGEITVRSQDADNDSSSSKVAGKVAGRVAASLNPHRLMAMLGAHGGEDFTLQFEDELSPILIECDGAKMTMTQTRIK